MSLLVPISFSYSNNYHVLSTSHRKKKKAGEIVFVY